MGSEMCIRDRRQASVCNCLNCVQNCDDHGLLDFKYAVQYMKHFHISLQSSFSEKTQEKCCISFTSDEARVLCLSASSSHFWRAKNYRRGLLTLCFLAFAFSFLSFTNAGNLGRFSFKMSVSIISLNLLSSSIVAQSIFSKTDSMFPS